MLWWMSLLDTARCGESNFPPRSEKKNYCNKWCERAGKRLHLEIIKRVVE